MDLLLSQKGRMFIFGAEGLVKVLCIHLFQDTTVLELSQSQSINSCKGQVKEDYSQFRGGGVRKRK